MFLCIQVHDAGQQKIFNLFSPHSGGIYTVQVRCKPDHGLWSEWSAETYVQVPVCKSSQGIHYTCIWSRCHMPDAFTAKTHNTHLFLGENAKLLLLQLNYWCWVVNVILAITNKHQVCKGWTTAPVSWLVILYVKFVQNSESWITAKVLFSSWFWN